MGSRVIKLNGRKKNLSREFYKCLVTNIRLCQIAGCAPFMFSGRGIEISVLAYCYLIILVAGYSTMLVYFFLTGRYMENISSQATLYASSFLLVITIWIEGSFRVKGWSVLLKKLIVIDQELLKFNISIDYGKFQRKSRWMLIGQLAQITLPVLTYCYSHDQLLLENLFLFLFLPNSAIICLTYALSDVVCLVEERLRVLNDVLKTLTIGKVEELNTVDGGKDKRKPLEILCHVCTWHHNINKLVRMISEIFGFRMVALFGYAFVVEVFHIYLICQQFNNEINWKELLYSVTCTVSYAYCIYMVSNACENTIKEAGKSGFLIHQIETSDCNMIDEIEMFSLQMANEDIEFSAAGFFPVNTSLMFSIIGGVTTYIIILIQLNSGPTIALNNTTTEMIDEISTTYETTIV